MTLNNENSAAQQFAALVAEASGVMQQQGLDPNTGRPADSAPGQVAVDPAALAAVNDAQAARSEGGRRFYEHDAAYRARCEAARARVMNGERFDVQAFITGRPAAPLQPAAQPMSQQAPAMPGGSPVDRLIARFEKDEAVRRDELPDDLWNDLCGGFRVDDLLPGDINASESAILKAVSESGSGITEQQVRAVIAYLRQQDG